MRSVNGRQGSMPAWAGILQIDADEDTSHGPCKSSLHRHKPVLRQYHARFHAVSFGRPEPANRSIKLPARCSC